MRCVSARTLLLLGLVILLVAGCTSRGGPGGRQASTPSRPTSPAPATTITAERSTTRTCETQIRTRLGPDWRKDGVVVGPLAFIPLARFANHHDLVFRNSLGGPGFQQVKAVIEAGVTVTVRVAAEVRRVAALLYDTSAFAKANDYLLDDGEQRVTFVACPGERTQFNGGFLVTRPSCVPLEVQVANALPRRVVVSFGAGHCDR
jgi:hypothetical protein